MKATERHRTPKLSTIRAGWAKGHPFPLTTDPDERYAEFDRWLAAHDAEIRADAWDEGAAPRQCRCAAWDEGECGCGNYPSEPNPYRAPRQHYELFPGTQEALDALSIYRKG